MLHLFLLNEWEIHKKLESMTGEKSRFGPGLIRIHLVPALEQQLKELYRTCNSSLWSLVDVDSLIMDFKKKDMATLLC